MEIAKIESYSLYQTFNCNIPKRNLIVSEKKQLVKHHECFENDEKIAFLRLILEHARLEGVDTSQNILPYDGKNTEDGPEFEINNFPRELQWILFKFAEMCATKRRSD